MGVWAKKGKVGGSGLVGCYFLGGGKSEEGGPLCVDMGMCLCVFVMFGGDVS